MLTLCPVNVQTGNKMTQFCPNPFEWLDLTAWGRDEDGKLRSDIAVKLSCCVESWSGPDARLGIMSFDEAVTIGFDRIWNSDKAIAIRKQVSETGAAAFCETCPRRSDGGLDVVESDRFDFPPLPRTLNLAYDHSCNMACPSCRTSPIIHSPGTLLHASIQRFQNAVVKPLLKTARRAFLSGLGDPFGSPLYRELLYGTQPGEAPDVKWFILTNGLGFTSDAYSGIPTRAQIDAVQFSIDAASPETHRQNRIPVHVRDADAWDRVLNNLAFASQLRRDGFLESLVVSMVVQWNNYKEVPAFIELAKRHSADTVIFSELGQQGTYCESDYRQRAVCNIGHPEHNAAISLLTEAKRATGIKVIVEMLRG